MRQAWIRLAVSYWMDPKFNGLGPTHEAFYIRLLGYSVEHHTDGLIHANAIALCGRGIRNRDKLLDEMVAAGLLVRREGDTSAPLGFTEAWYRWQTSHASSEHKIAGQAGSLARTRLEESRGIYNKSLGSRSAAQWEAAGFRHLPGSGWVKDHDTDTDTEATKE